MIRLWKIAGADSQLLISSPFTDQLKMAALGLLVLSVIVAAWVSFTFALMMIFVVDNGASLFEKVGFYSFYIALGTIWLLVVFNIYRIIISADGYGDGTSEITKEEIQDNVLKIIMAVVLAVCLTAPISVLLLHNEISSEAFAIHQRSIVVESDTIDSQYQRDLNQLYRSLAEATIDMEKRRLSGGDQNSQDYSKIANDIRHNISLLQQQIEKKKSDLQSKMVKNYRYSLIQEVKLVFSMHKAIFISVMFFMILICVGPIFLRMVWVKGVYEYLSEFQNKLVLAKYGIHSDIEIFKTGEKIIQESYSVPGLILEETLRNLDLYSVKFTSDLKAKNKKKMRLLKSQLS